MSTKLFLTFSLSVFCAFALTGCAPVAKPPKGMTCIEGSEQLYASTPIFICDKYVPTGETIAPAAH